MPASNRPSRTGVEPKPDEEATGDAEIVEPGEGDEPKIGEALDVTGEEMPQVGKHPDLPPEMPVQAGTALDPALPPLEPQKTRLEPED